MPVRSPVLILGATGMLGHVAVGVLGSRFEVQATVRDIGAARPVLSVPLHRLDASDRPQNIEDVLDASRPQVVVNCIGIVKQLPEASDPVMSIRVNALFPHLVAAACRDRSIRLIHVSTDCVFSGRLQPPAAYTEEDEPDALDLYGRSKLLGEVVEAPALTLRTSIIGRELRGAGGLLGWLLSRARQPVQGYRHAIFSGLTTRAFASVLERIIVQEPDISGLYHVSAEPISKLDLISELNTTLGLGCEVEAVNGPRVNRALDASRFRARTQIDIPSWPAMIADLAVEEDVSVRAKPGDALRKEPKRVR
jgi:dTDP-4-dehydrorhamnose reductase